MEQLLILDFIKRVFTVVAAVLERLKLALQLSTEVKRSTEVSIVVVTVRIDGRLVATYGKEAGVQ